MFETLCAVIFAVLVLWAGASAFYRGYQSKNRDQEMLYKTGIILDDTEDDGLLNSDGRPDM